jgi:SAM-dependent methyltransferase
MTQAHSWGESLLAVSMWSYATSVLYPAQALKRTGLTPSPHPIGERAEPLARRGLGRWFSTRHRRPVLLANPKGLESVEEFDRLADVYDAFVEPFSRPIFDEALEVMRPHLPPDARVLDLGCGSGREASRVARSVPEGEVVGIDLAAGMVGSAFRAARAGGLDNCAFFQADVAELPETFSGRFDLAYSSLAHHHYPDPPSATAGAFRCLRPGGVYCVVDPGPAWFKLLASPLAKLGDPGWVGFTTPDEFLGMFRSAGFTRASWTELLPGFGIAMGQKPPGAV